MKDAQKTAAGKTETAVKTAAEKAETADPQETVRAEAKKAIQERAAAKNAGPSRRDPTPAERQQAHLHRQEMPSLQRARARSSSIIRIKTSSPDSTDAKTARADAEIHMTTFMTRELLRSRNVIRRNIRPRQWKNLQQRNSSLKEQSLSQLLSLLPDSASRLKSVSARSLCQ